MSDASAPVIAGILRFLRDHAPFSRMADADLDWMARRLELGYHPKDSVILDPGQGVPRRLYIVQRGAVCHRPFSAEHGGADQAVVRGPGECFSVAALLESRPVITPYIAVADTFTYELAAADFNELIGRSAPLREFATGFLASMLEESRRLLKLHHSATAAEQQTMSRPLRSLVAREPVSCAAGTPIGDVLRTMQARKIGSMLVVDEARRPLGIFTRHDVLDRIALAGCPLATPIREVMTRDPLTLPAEASAYEAALLIADRGIRHIPVIDGGCVIGVVTERDLFALQRVSLRAIHRGIAAAAGLDDLRSAAGDIRRLAKVMLGQGVSSQHLTMIVSTLNDALTRRLIELEIPRYGLEGLRWTWLAFGSEGRLEQTISTDQDNGLVFDAAESDTNALRARLLPFARAVNAALDACGFPLCKGNIMAGNPEWCLSLEEWRRLFSGWVANTDPQAVLGAVIFFDLRQLHGDAGIAEALRGHVNGLCQGNARFRRELAREALRTRPPLGLISDFVTEQEGPQAGTLDLKASGSRLFTDAARVMALAGGVAQTSTVERLRHSGTALGVPAAETESFVEAFHFLQTLRLRSQIGNEAGSGPNRIAPAQLNEVDRRILKESLRQARKLQSRLALDYDL
jgi:CBS domain-containing protein